MGLTNLYTASAAGNHNISVNFASGDGSTSSGGLAHARRTGWPWSGGAQEARLLEFSLRATAGRVIDGNRESWYRAWLSLADRILGAAESSAARGHRDVL